MKKNAFLFEVSWEVCNKVGGIYTVLTTKLPFVLNDFGDRYFAVGPWVEGQERLGFTEQEPPAILQQTFEALREHQIFPHFGIWKSERSEAQSILIDFSKFAENKNYFKTLYWEQYKLDSLNTDYYDFDVPLIWSTAVGVMVDIFSRFVTDRRQYVNLHAHEWMSSGSILYVKSLAKTDTGRINTIFTTHATALGRALTSRNIFHEDQLKITDDTTLASEFGVLAKHLTEKIATKISDKFTTVSHITANECQRLLGTRPLVVENGMDFKNFPSLIDLKKNQKASRLKLNAFLTDYFEPYYKFNPHKTFIQFTMGRYEFHNKGYDLHLEALARLNDYLKSKPNSDNVVALFLVPGDFVSMLDPAVKLSLPPISPYQMRCTGMDPIITKALSLDLVNAESDKVKIIFIPTYLNGNDGLFNRHLYDIVEGCDLGVFASAYEPWGYTPMESLILGVPAITSKLAGFGEALSKIRQKKPVGALILNREIKNDLATIDSLLNMMIEMVNDLPHNSIKRKESAYSIIKNFDWKIIYPKYSKLYK